MRSRPKMGRPLSVMRVLRIAGHGLALLALLDAALVMAGQPLGGRPPVGAEASTVSAVMTAIFVLIAEPCAGIGREAGRIGALASAPERPSAARLRAALGRLDMTARRAGARPY